MNISQNYRGAGVALVFAALLVMLFTACGSDPITEGPAPTTALMTVGPIATPEATPTSDPTPTPTETPVPMVKPEPTPTATPEPTATPASTIASRETSRDGVENHLNIRADTTWQDVFDDSIPSVRDCFREALGDELERALGLTVSNDYRWEELLPCLEPETARFILVSGTIASLESQGWDLSDEQISCLHVESADINTAAVMSENRQEGGEFISTIFSCAPEPLIYFFVEGFGIRRGDLAEGEISCLEESLSGFDWSVFAGQDSGEPGEFIGLIFPCIPDPWISLVIVRFGLSFEDLNDGEVSCLRDGLATVDLASVGLDSAVAAELAAILFFCIPGPVAYATLLGTISPQFGLFTPLWFEEELLEREQISCLQREFEDYDWTGFVMEHPTALAEFIRGLFYCAPEPLILYLGSDHDLEVDKLSEDEVNCARELMGYFNWSRLLPDDSDAFSELAAGVQSCIPQLQETQEGN